MNFDNYLFRCSSLPTLMTKSRSVIDPLSETAKTYLKELYIKELYGREKYDIKSKFTDKGIACESDSLDLVQKVSGVTHFKNKKEFANEWIKGTPDVVTPLIDIKTSWDIWTFANVDEDYARKAYYYQVLGYMWLTGKTSSEVSFCLVNTPEEMMFEELRRLAYKYPEIDESEEKMEPFKKNYIFDDIPEVLRVKSFTFECKEEDIENVKERIGLARLFLNQTRL